MEEYQNQTGNCRGEWLEEDSQDHYRVILLRSALNTCNIVGGVIRTDAGIESWDYVARLLTWQCQDVSVLCVLKIISLSSYYLRPVGGPMIGNDHLIQGFVLRRLMVVITVDTWWWCRLLSHSIDSIEVKCFRGNRRWREKQGGSKFKNHDHLKMKKKNYFILRLKALS